jgi:hypothetical protein
MNKDALLATLIGFAIGLFITGMLLVGPKLAKYFPKMSFKLPSFSISQKTPNTTPTPSKDFAVSIDSPIPDSIESESTLLVSGTTSADATVVIQGVVDDAAVQTKTDGKYAGKILLIEGKNDITVTSYLKEKKATQTITVFYTPEEL